MGRGPSEEEAPTTHHLLLSRKPAALARELLARDTPRSHHPDLDAAAAVANIAPLTDALAPFHETGLCSAAQLLFLGIPFDNDRSAICRGQPHHPPSDTGRSEVGGPAPSDSSPPSLPPRAPSSTARPHTPEAAAWAAEALADMATDEGAKEVAYNHVQVDVIDSPEEAQQNSQIDSPVARGPTPELGPAPTAEQALTDGLHRIHLARTDGQVQQLIHPLAVALGAKRTEAGTVKALHAVLLQLAAWPRMTNHEACACTGASASNFSKWRRHVQNIPLLDNNYPSLASSAQDTPAAASAPLTWGNAPPS